VVEADGRVLLEGPREASDTLLAIIDAPRTIQPDHKPRARLPGAVAPAPKT
jgi:hypothetical protein